MTNPKMGFLGTRWYQTKPEKPGGPEFSEPQNPIEDTNSNRNSTFFQTHKKHMLLVIYPISHVTSHRILYYPLVNVYMTMGNHHVQWGFIHYFDWVIFHSKLLVITRGCIYI
jgi:hypothetical protein